MVRGEYTKGMVVLLLLLAPTLAVAVPTMSGRAEGFVAHALYPASDTYRHCGSDSSDTIGLISSDLAPLAAEFHRRYVSFGGSPAPAKVAESLPPIPRALLMAVTGFICVSLVRDRRYWLGAFAGLLWVGQFGFATLPRVVSRLAGKKQAAQASSGAAICLSKGEHSRCLSSHAEGARRANVSLYLAEVPVCGALLQSQVLPSSRGRKAPESGQEPCTCSSNLGRNRLSTMSAQAQDESGTDQPSMTGFLSCLIRTNNRSVPGGERVVCFARASGCTGLARSPPAPGYCVAFRY